MSEETLDPPLRLNLGNWRGMAYDAKTTLDGIDWYRAKGGFGAGREDWVGDLSESNLHAMRYLQGDGWGHSGETPTRDAAMRESVASARYWIDPLIEKEFQRVSDLLATRRQLIEAVRLATEDRE